MSLKQNTQRGGALLALALLLSGIVSPLASAAEANPTGAFNVVVSPPSVGLEVKPGSSVSTDIKVQNNGLATEHVRVTLMKFGAKGSDGTPQLLDLKSDDESAKWVTFSTTLFDAKPKEWVTVKMTVSPPAGAAFGYYYAAIFSRDGADKQVKSKSANLIASVASLVLVDVKSPGAVRKVDVAEFSTEQKSSEFLPVTFNVRMHNTGNVHVATRGNIVISRGGKQLAILEVNLSKGYVLPNSYRVFSTDWTDGKPVYVSQIKDGKVLKDKQGNTLNKLSWDNFSMSQLRYGKYDAKLAMVYNDGHNDISSEAKLSFWVIPWRIIAAILVVALFVLAGAWVLLIRPLLRKLKQNRGYAQRR